MSRPPSVDRLARSLSDSGLPHPLLVEVARDAIATDRVDEAPALARRRARRLLAPVINATGVLLHTNLGRAQLAHEQAASATNLELDLETGTRGSRQRAVGELLATACDAEAAMIVNNCAAAVLLTLAALAPGRGVAVSRGELVEIGGGFRIPDVMEQSGARLVEVGTTNRTRLADFQRAIDQGNDGGDPLALAMHIHRSNYEIVGFTESVSIKALATLPVPIVADIGSGLLDAACPWIDGPPPAWLEGEPAARQSLTDGAALVIFSGDKLFGGPQAGIIAGDRDLVERCSRHPLARALRPGGLTLSALQHITLRYLERDGMAIPFWRAATTSIDELQARGERIIDGLPNEVTATVIESDAVPGGGTLPTVSIPSRAIAVAGNHVNTLRAFDRPIIARQLDAVTVLDLRSISADDDDAIIDALSRLATASSTE